MLLITEITAQDEPYNEQLILPFDRRQKSRLRVTLASGEEAGIFMARGTVLRGGDRLKAADGRVVLIVAADEPVMRVTADTPIQLMRAAYHLGNRHIPLEVGEGWLKLLQDHVLQEMLTGLGVAVVYQEASFEPEGGAYGGGHRHSGDDSPAEFIRLPLSLRKRRD